MKRNLPYSCFFFPLFHEHLFSPGLPCATHLLETSCLEKITMYNQDNACDIAACPDEQSTKRSEPKKPSTNQDKHRKGLQTSVIHLIPGSTCH